MIEEALENGNPYELLITDMHFPARGVLDENAGMYVIEELKNKGIDIPIIVCSSVRYRIPDILGCVFYSRSCDLSWDFKDLLSKLNKEPENYRKVKKEELAAHEETVNNMIRSLVWEASDIASWVFVKKYVEGWTLEQMVEDMPHAVKFIVAMDTLFEKNMGNLPEDKYKN